MTNSAIANVQTSNSSLKQPDKRLPQCTLKWRQRHLLVKLSQQVEQPQLPSLKNEQWLVECLKHSLVRLIRIDPDLDEAVLGLWVDACEQANKPVFLRLPTAHTLLKQRSSLRWWLKRLIDYSVAVLLLVVLSPVMLGIILLMRVYQPGPILFRQWYVGERGKLFRVFKFRTTLVDGDKLEYKVMGNQKSLHDEDDFRLTPLGCWMRKHNLDELPQLFNVLRGEMSLVGPRPRTLYDSVRITPEERQQLNALPGITGAWQSGSGDDNQTNAAG